MANITATRRLQWCSGHRVKDHEGKCATLHGHNYVGYFTAQADNLDSVGRVIDFSVLKEKIGNWIDSFWDHTMLIYEQDKKTLKCILDAPSKKHPFICEFNPTAENMADYLLREVCPKVLKGTGVEVVAIKLYETENCFAEVKLDQ